MNNINPIDVINDSIDNLRDGFEITVHSKPFQTYILIKDEGVFMLSDGDENDILINTNNDIIKNFFNNLDITEIDLRNLSSNTSEVIFFCETDCYYKRNKSANKIQKKWKSYNKLLKQKRRLIRNIRNRETGLPFSFGKKRTYKFELDIKYLESL